MIPKDSRSYTRFNRWIASARRSNIREIIEKRSPQRCTVKLKYQKKDVEAAAFDIRDYLISNAV
jgi:hypothetical protein